jgi:hypothetical protein
MVDEALPEYSLKIGEKTYKLEYSLYSFAKLKKAFGINAMAGQVDFNDPEHVLYFLWAGLITHDRSLDGNVFPDGNLDDQLESAVRMLGTFLTLSKMREVSALVMEAFLASTGATEPVKKKRPSRASQK